ncbi:hypothetical protein GCM10023174_29480 [Chelativorans composti]
MPARSRSEPGTATAIAWSGPRVGTAPDTNGSETMSVDTETVKRVAKLARIAIDDEAASRMTGELNAILGFVEQLNEVDVAGVEPMTSVIPMAMRMRADEVTDGNKAADIVANAPTQADNFFMVPKVVE